MPFAPPPVAAAAAPVAAAPVAAAPVGHYFPYYVYLDPHDPYGHHGHYGSIVVQPPPRRPRPRLNELTDEELKAHREAQHEAKKLRDKLACRRKRALDSY